MGRFSGEYGWKRLREDSIFILVVLVLIFLPRMSPDFLIYFFIGCAFYFVCMIAAEKDRILKHQRAFDKCECIEADDWFRKDRPEGFYHLVVSKDLLAISFEDYDEIRSSREFLDACKRVILEMEEEQIIETLVELEEVLEKSTLTDWVKQRIKDGYIGKDEAASKVQELQKELQEKERVLKELAKIQDRRRNIHELELHIKELKTLLDGIDSGKVDEKAARSRKAVESELNKVEKQKARLLKEDSKVPAEMNEKLAEVDEETLHRITEKIMAGFPYWVYIARLRDMEVANAEEEAKIEFNRILFVLPYEWGQSFNFSKEEIPLEGYDTNVDHTRASFVSGGVVVQNTVALICDHCRGDTGRRLDRIIDVQRIIDIEKMALARMVLEGRVEMKSTKEDVRAADARAHRKELQYDKLVDRVENDLFPVDIFKRQLNVHNALDQERDQDARSKRPWIIATVVMAIIIGIVVISLVVIPNLAPSIPLPDPEDVDKVKEGAEEVVKWIRAYNPWRRG